MSLLCSKWLGHYSTIGRYSFALSQCFKKSALVRVPIRLGADSFLKGKISEENKIRLLKAMEAFKLLMDVHGVTNYYACGTSAMREASNGVEVIEDIFEKTSVKINIIDGKKDTVMKVYPQIRIKLTDDFGKELLAKSGLVDLSDNTAFLNAYKGFYLTAKNLSGNGGVMSFDLTNANRSYIILYYKNSTDTSNFIFNINSVAANVNRYEHDYSNTKVQYQFTDTVQGQQNAYAQSLAGTRVRIRFPDLELRKDSNKIAINKAELIIPIETGSDSKFAPISTLSLKARRKGSSTEYLISSGVYDASKKQ